MKILLAASKMNHGGAESHLYELASALFFASHELTLVSEGGKTADRLRALGVKTVYAPLSKKDPFSLLRAQNIIDNLCKRENFDIVHAHTRVAAFICARLKRKYGFAFVTTAHALFSASGAKRLSSHWGDKTIAVSEDIKKHLTKNFGVSGAKITVIKNGIDTHSFRPNREHKSGTKIIFVSRLDKDSSLCAELLIGLAPRLKKRYPSLTITIVGGGEEYKRLQKLALDSNAKIGKKTIFMLGARDDLDRILQKHDLFVGVSRAALEALFCELPVILGGNEGYLGVLTKEKLGEAQKTNFCCRGEGRPTQAKLYRDVCLVLDGKADNFVRGEDIKDEYSSEAMTQSTIAFYKSALAEHKEKVKRKFIKKRTPNYVKHKFSPSRNGIIFNGYYGFGNLGDEGTLSLLVKKIREAFPTLPITVLSADPHETQRKCGANAIYRYSLPRILQEMRRSSLTLIGGGTVLQDKSSLHSLLYYILIMKMARAVGCKTALFANGIGPLKREISRVLVRKVLLSADYISLRDRDSLSLAKKLCGEQKSAFLSTKKPCVRHKNLYLGADIAFFTDSPKKSSTKTTSLVPDLISRQSSLAPGSTSHQVKFAQDSNKHYIAVSVRPLPKRVERKVEPELATALTSLKKSQDLVPLYLLMHPEKDLAPTLRLKRACGGQILKIQNADECLRVLSACEAAIGMRLHFLIYSALSGLVPLPIIYDNKVSAFSKDLCLPHSLVPYKISARKIIGAVSSLLSKRKALAYGTKMRVLAQKRSAEADLLRLFSFIDKLQNF